MNQVWSNLNRHKYFLVRFELEIKRVELELNKIQVNLPDEHH